MRKGSSSGAGRWAVLLAVVAVSLILPAASGASFPGLNGRIAFQKPTPLGEFDFESALWSMNQDGSGTTRLTSGKDAFDGAYSPDGSRLAFSRYNEILVAAADGTGARPLTLGSESETTSSHWVANYKDPGSATVYPWVKVKEDAEFRDDFSEPSFSPDGATLAVSRFTTTFVNTAICSVNADKDENCNGSFTRYEYDCRDCGSSIEAIDANTGALRGTLAPRVKGFYLEGATYSRSGALAYTRDPAGGGGGGQLLTVAAPGAPPSLLASGEPEDPDFSPDGSRIVFSSDDHAIGIVPAAGGTPTTIPVPPPTPSDEHWLARSPVWSPDGSQIALGILGVPPGDERYSDGGTFLIGPDGSGLRAIQGQASVPTGWQPIPLTPARPVKGKKKLRLSKKGVAVVGSVVCGSTPCSLKATVRKLKVGKKRFGVKATVPASLAAGASAPLKIKVKGKAMAALKAKGGGRLSLTVALADTSGAQTVRFAPKLLPPKHTKPKRGKKHG